MTLRTIHISNVKGIANRIFPLNIIPNKPSLLYAPNGFGKSSFAIAFYSLTGPRLSLHKDNYHNANPLNLPSLSIEYLKPDGTIVNLLADSNGNTIKSELDCFVINNKVRPKSTPMQFNGRTQYTASLNIDTIELISSIPADINLGYSIAAIRGRWGANGKVLPNLELALNKRAFILVFYDNFRDLVKLTQKRNSDAIQSFKDRVNLQGGSSDQILNWIEANELGTLDEIAPLKELADKIMNLDLGFTLRAERILVILEMLDLYSENLANFKLAFDRKLYIQEKNSYIESFKAFNSTWKDIRPREKEGKLIIEFPKAHNISNGQRDILCLVALLEVARRKLKKAASILIIDEVFDYLDEGNLVAAQYYISEFIKDFKSQGRRIYPLILTHLNPGYFKSYAFNNMKTYYLDTRTATVSLPYKNLIVYREDPTIEDDVSRYLLHYHTGNINKRAEFTALGLRPTWGEGSNFINHLRVEIDKYLTDQPDYDPFAVCCALRRRVEENVYQNIPGVAEKGTFLATHQTKSKLEYAETTSVIVPEYYYLLGNVYNDGLHWKTDRDNESPLKAKLENGTIRKLIRDVFG